MDNLEISYKLPPKIVKDFGVTTQLWSFEDSEAALWLKNNNIKYDWQWDILNYDDNDIAFKITFTNIDDALLFKLKWT
jgi:hypothetical protein